MPIPPSQTLARYNNVRHDLVQVRCSKILHALVESDIGLVRKEMVQLCRHYEYEHTVAIWNWKEYILLQLKSVALTRFQIHLLLCVLPMAESGFINVPRAVQICVTMIERFFNVETFYAQAADKTKQLEQEAKTKELEELGMAGDKRGGKKVGVCVELVCC